MIHSANPTRQRKEERLLRERLAALDGKVDELAKLMDRGGAEQSAPLPSKGAMP
jgi:hypothetical protein